MIKKVFFFVGPYGSGKSSVIKKFADKSFHFLLEDDALLFFLKNENLFVRALQYLSVIWFSLTREILLINSFQNGSHFLLVDGHPCQPLLYSECLFILNKRSKFSFQDLMFISKIHFDLFSYNILQQKILNGWEQIIFYLNPPKDIHWKMISERFKSRPNFEKEESNYEYFLSLRNVFNSRLPYLASDIYNCKLVEINDLSKIEDEVMKYTTSSIDESISTL